MHVSLSGSLLTSGSHVLISDVGLNIDDGLRCWINSRVIGDFNWYHKLEENQKYGSQIEGSMIYRGWYTHNRINVFLFKILTRILETAAVEGIFTCRHRDCGSCLVSVDIHYPGEYHTQISKEQISHEPTNMTSNLISCSLKPLRINLDPGSRYGLLAYANILSLW